MKTTKSILMILAAAVVIPALNSCKKGEDDPFLSLKSRKARVTGEWIIDEWEQEASYTSSYTNSGSTTNNSGSNSLKISGTGVTTSETASVTDVFGTSNFTSNGNGGATATMTFEKDGTFSRKLEFKNVNVTSSTGGSSSMTSTFNLTIETSGTWNFLGGVEEDYKNKERMILNILEEKTTSSYTSSGDTGNGTDTQTYANGEYTEVWTLTSLKNKEMLMEGTTNNIGSYTDTDNSGGMAYTTSGSSNSSGTMSATLTQK